MSGLSDLLDADFADVLAEAGERVTYTPADGSAASTISAILGAVELRPDMEGAGEYEVQVRRVGVSLADIAAPALGDRITFDGSTWAVGRIALRGGSAASLEAVLVDHESLGDPRRFAEPIR